VDTKACSLMASRHLPSSTGDVHVLQCKSAVDGSTSEVTASYDGIARSARILGRSPAATFWPIFEIPVADRLSQQHKLYLIFLHMFHSKYYLNYVKL
jgi:hypothetical protein